MAKAAPHGQVLRIGKLTGKNIIEVAAKHNHREILAEIGAAPGGHIDPRRCALNQVLRGPASAAGVADLAHELLEQAGIKPEKLRKDAVRVVEIIFSLPPDSTVDPAQFFPDAVAWAEHRFAVPVLSAIAHHDEAAPHCHVLLLPLMAGRMAGSDLVGGRQRLQAMQDDFHVKVGRRYDLARKTAPTRRSAAARRHSAEQIAAAIMTKPEILQDRRVRLMLVEALTANPEPMMEALDLPITPMSQRGKKEWVEIMTKPCEKDKPYRD